MEFTSPDLQGALCAQADPEEWFPDLGQITRRAKQICARCPVQQKCLAWALRTGERHGIWGGTTALERRAMRRTGANHA